MFGEFHHLYELRQQPAKFMVYMRIKIETFDNILSLIPDKIQKRDSTAILAK